MGDISKNFNRSEFTCKCGECDDDTVDTELVKIYQGIRDHFAKPVRITSGCRCSKHNASVGGAVNSQHKKGRAGDGQISGVSPYEISLYVENKYLSDHGGIGLYDTFIHIDTRTQKARWDKRTDQAV